MVARSLNLLNHMPKYSPQDEEMEDLYPSKPDAEEETESAEDEGAESVDEEAAEESTALVPKSALAGCDCKEGSTITMKVVKNYGDEVLLEPVNTPSKPTEPSADEEIDGMDQKEMS